MLPPETPQILEIKPVIYLSFGLLLSLLALTRMAQRKTSNMFSTFNWALLTIGVSQIILKVFGPLDFLIAVIICSCVYGFFLVKSPDTKGSPRAISTALVYCSIQLLIGNLIFGYLVFIEWDNRWIGLYAVAACLFFGLGLLSSAILSKIFHVA
jgi:hypothetical protein